jgi:hypothetical protein
VANVAGRRPRTSLREPLTIAAGCLVLLAYVLLWARTSPLQTGRADFTNAYVGATLLRTGHAASMYSPALQDPLYLRLVAPLHTGVLPYLEAPTAAALALPYTLLSLHIAYRLWSLTQLLLIAAAAGIAVWAAPRRTVGRARLAANALLALGGAGTLMTLVLGQWDGLWALGLALVYMWLRQRRMGVAGFALGMTALVAKPQLALGLAALVLGWRDRRLLLGSIGGALTAVLLWLAIAGVGGVTGFVGAVVHSVGVWQPSVMVSFVGITGVLVGNTAAAHVLGAAGSLLLMGVGAAVGAALRGRPARLEAGLASAAFISLLAAPHAYPQDLAMLVPAAAWSLTALSATMPAGLWSAALLAWVATTLAVLLDIATRAAPPLGVLTPWSLIAAAALAVAVCLRQAGVPERPGPDPATDRGGAARALPAG